METAEAIARERVRLVLELARWRKERDRAGERFVSFPNAWPSILLNEDFLQYQRAWAQIGILEAKLRALNKGIRI